MNFRHLLEKPKLSRQLFKEVNKWLSGAGIYLKEGTIVDATIIKAASPAKNKTKARDPETANKTVSVSIFRCYHSFIV